MAGTTKGVFPEKQTNYLKDIIAADWSAGIRRQYEANALEAEWIPKLDRKRHYEAEITKGIERLYETTILLEPHTACSAHCRHCLRGLYSSFTLNEKEMKAAIDYIASQKNATEVLITGGDPLINPKQTAMILDDIVKDAPHIKIVRIGSRLPVQNPELMHTLKKDDYKNVFRKRKGIEIELATQINDPIELLRDESAKAYRIAQDEGVKVYNQAVLLKGVNNDFNTLVHLYNKCRSLQIEPHYLFHAIPMKGTSHLRTSLREAVNLQVRLTSSGKISGRAKPRLAALTDVGKVEFYPNTIKDYRETRHTTTFGRNVIVPEYLLKTGYKESERLNWNPHYKKSSSTSVDKDGFYNVWYMDAWKNA